MSENNILGIKFCLAVEPPLEGSVRLWALWRSLWPVSFGRGKNHYFLLLLCCRYWRVRGGNTQLPWRSDDVRQPTWNIHLSMSRWIPHRPPYYDLWRYVFYNSRLVMQIWRFAVNVTEHRRHWQIIIMITWWCRIYSENSQPTCVRIPGLATLGCTSAIRRAIMLYYYLLCKSYQGIRKKEKMKKKNAEKNTKKRKRERKKQTNQRKHTKNMLISLLISSKKAMKHVSSSTYRVAHSVSGMDSSPSPPPLQ